MNTLPKHIQEAATPLTDAKEHWHTCEDGFHSIDPVPEKHKGLGTHVPIEFARNLERITIWQQEVMEKLVASLRSHDGSNYCEQGIGLDGDDSLEQYTQLQSYLKTLKGEK